MSQSGKYVLTYLSGFKRVRKARAVEVAFGLDCAHHLGLCLESSEGKRVYHAGLVYLVRGAPVTITRRITPLSFLQTPEVMFIHLATPFNQSGR